MTGSARRRPSTDVLLAVVLPLLCAVVLLAVHSGQDQPTRTHGPSPTELQTASLVCPSALAGTDVLGATTLADGPGGDADGRATVGLGSDTSRVPVGTDRVSSLSAGSGPVVVTGSGSIAPGLAAGRSGSTPLSATDCSPVRGDQWFTGVGAGATHDSILELVNPASGTAAADVTLWSSTGVVDVDRLRGVSVPGGTSVQLDLGQLAPRRGSLAVQVHVDRGQLATDVVDTDVDSTTGAASRDWLPAQTRPVTSNLLLGLAGGAGSRALTVLDQGSAEARVTLQVVTATGVFTPTGVDPVRVPPDATTTVSLSGLLPDQVAQGAIGLLVTSSVPVTAGLRQVTGGDLSDLAPAAALTSSSTAVVPAGAKRLLLAGAATAGSADVSWYAADGSRLGGQAVAVKSDQGADIAVPDDAVLVSVDPANTGVRAAVITSTDQGTAVVSLRDLQRTGLVPDVAPGLP